MFMKLFMTKKELIVEAIMEYMDLGLNIQATLTLTITNKLLEVMVGLVISLVPDPSQSLPLP